ncbi:hypothetical protein E2C01_013940 [Portunus trituberculatus]|uniref:Uncharacterized protein n=1 Tax=Portunus trituberculatus TaxID=210409 RepID=A0A5B7DHI9_PORTR|nr:hypothetical protein [Portunus trituberculatus]
MRHGEDEAARLWRGADQPSQVKSPCATLHHNTTLHDSVVAKVRLGHRQTNLAPSWSTTR